MKTASLAALLVAAVLLGCGEGSEPAPPEQSPAERADAYALERSGGEREGCSQVAPGTGADVPGCIYSAAFAGCMEGITGKPTSPVSYREEFPEPELRKLYEQARADCA